MVGTPSRFSAEVCVWGAVATSAAKDELFPTLIQSRAATPVCGIRNSPHACDSSRSFNDALQDVPQSRPFPDLRHARPGDRRHPVRPGRQPGPDRLRHPSRPANRPRRRTARRSWSRPPIPWTRRPRPVARISIRGGALLRPRLAIGYPLRGLAVAGPRVSAAGGRRTSGVNPTRRRRRARPPPPACGRRGAASPADRRRGTSPRRSPPRRASWSIPPAAPPG